MYRSTPAKLSCSKRALRRPPGGRPDFRFSQTTKGPAQLNRTGPPDGLAVCLPGCNRLKLPGCSSEFAYHKYSGIRTYFKAKIALKNRGFGERQKLVFSLWNALILPGYLARSQLIRAKIRDNRCNCSLSERWSVRGSQRRARVRAFIWGNVTRSDPSHTSRNYDSS